MHGAYPFLQGKEDTLRIAYLAHFNLSPESGVAKKIASTITIWKDLNAEVVLYVITRQADVADWALSLGGKAFTYTGGSYSVKKLSAIDRATKDILRWKPHAVYLRRDLVYPGYVQLALHLPLVQEVNSDELAELKLYSRIQYLYHLTTRNLLDRRTRGWVFVTRELCAAHPYFSKLPGRKIVVANGIDLERFPHLPPSTAPQPTLAFLGYSAPWHGVDKILKLAQEFPGWRFHLIGVSGEQFPDSPPNVYFHGRLSFSEYLPILTQSHVAIGTLALHRNHMNEASPLKVREYLALGLPTIIGYKDTDFPQGAPFLLELPNVENNVESSADAVLRFVEEWKDKRVLRSEILHLDLRKKEQDRLHFLKGVANVL